MRRAIPRLDGLTTPSIARQHQCMTVFLKPKRTAGEIARAREDRAFFASVMLLFVIDILATAIGKISFRKLRGEMR